VESIFLVKGLFKAKTVKYIRCFPKLLLKIGHVKENQGSFYDTSVVDPDKIESHHFAGSQLASKVFQHV
jgi:hypothetical protein